MRLADSIILSLCVAIFIMGVYETMTAGIAYSYWLFMFSVGLLFWYSYRRREATNEPDKVTKPGSKKKKKSSRR
ncbi:MAG: hypothetical protein RIG62_15440 [Cyclobacteriaceae bacterium]